MDAQLHLAFWLLGSNWFFGDGSQIKGRSSDSRNVTDSGTLLNISPSTMDHAWPVSRSSARTNGRENEDGIIHVYLQYNK
jgi:hypothetical protein